jgi:Raf kinase inhibitor-like YbhB/YbcL family protein
VPTPFRLTSPAFEPGAPIPRPYTCDGDDVSPSLLWGEPPRGTDALALIVEDPDAPRGTFTHWIGWGLPATLRALPEGVAPPVEGRNDFGSVGYRGPCPPPGHGVHRYFFRLYALTAHPELEAGAAAREFHEAITILIVDATELVGTYRR